MKTAILFACAICAASCSNAQGLFDRMTGRTPDKALQECAVAYDANERQAITDAASRPPGMAFSTYIPNDRGEWIGKCMNVRGYRSTFNSLANYDVQALGRLPREQINRIRQEDSDRAAATPAAWTKY